MFLIFTFDQDCNKRLKEDLDKQYRKWQGLIRNRNVNSMDIFFASFETFTIENKILTHQNNLRRLVLYSKKFEKFKKDLKLLIKELDQFLVQLNEKHQNFVQFVENFSSIDDDDKLRGLTTQRIQQFKLFTADESFVGDKCVICMEGVEIGRNMMRLDCDGKHAFCQVCIEGWFADHNTCPICRHDFCKQKLRKFEALSAY